MCNYGQAIFQEGIAQTVFNYMQNKGVCMEEAIRTLVTDEENAAACRQYIEEHLLP